MRIGLWGRKKKDLKAQLERQKTAQSDANLPGVSVVMVAQNEGRYLKDNLVYLLEQDYPQFEVVVVDYMSTDETKFVLQVCEQNYPNLKSIILTQDVNMFQGKKLPLSIGIKSAKHNVVMLIDPDCKPQGFGWIREMVASYGDKETKIVLGYCGVQKEKGLLNALQQYDNLCFSARYLSSAVGGHPTTGNGKNLSHEKKFFFANGAFTKHYTEPFGADDLFVNQNANAENTAICIGKEARTEMEGKKTFGQWRLARKQRASTYRLHSMAEKVTNLVHPLMTLAFYAALALLLVRHFPWYFVVGAFVLKTAWQMVSFSQLCMQFEVKRLWIFSPLLEIYFLFANTIIGISALHRKK